ncbi:MAG TPA: FIST C-terminal domain-containing protein, partial [Actinomycetota bacterium]|nr:FIST C-terminal domain-containing protein [Actinomycetota bacterium]
FHVRFEGMTGGGTFSGWPGRDPGTYLLLCDPFTFPAEPFLRELNDQAPGTVVIGGNASGGAGPGGTRLFIDRRVVEDGAVGCRAPGAVRALVSQGCRPVGRPFTVTRSDGNVIHELAGTPAVQRLQETWDAAAPPDRELIANGLLIGRVVNEYRSEFGPGDFLVRGVIGADRESGAIAVADHVTVGETVQFHVRDAATADEELRTLLERRLGPDAGRVAGALLFTCNGRGTHLFPEPDHDARMVDTLLAVPTAGFFAAGELGPVGDRTFVHGFTASLAVFLDGAER